ncbi:MAG: murein biosynthesis integral membrane protein MurJ [Bacillota bacterium]
MSGSKGVARAALVVMLMTFLSRILGLARDAAIAAAFGASGVTDAYMVAYTLPYALQAVSGVAFVIVVLPVVTSYLVAGRQEEGWQVASQIGNGIALLLTLAAVAGIGLAPWLVKAVAPGFSVAETELTIRLTRIMFPSIVFMGCGMLVSGMLNAGRRFSVAAFAPGVVNIVIILSVFLVASIEGVAWGTLAGFAAFLLVQLPDLKKVGFRYFPGLKLGHPAVRQALANLGPVLLAVSVTQVYLIMNRFFASFLLAGSITALDLANRTMNLPGIFVSSVYTAIFPALAERAVRGDREGLAQTLAGGLRMVIFLIVPASLGMMILKDPLISVLYQRGAFNSAAAGLTSGALLYFAVGYPGLAANTVLLRAYYALGSAALPAVLGLISLGLNLVLSLLLLPRMGHEGLALANSLATLGYSVLLVAVLKKRLPEISLVGLLSFTAKAGGAALVMGIGGLQFYRWLTFHLDGGSTIDLLGIIALTVGLCLFIYLAGAKLLGIQEGGRILQLISRKRV